MLELLDRYRHKIKTAEELREFCRKEIPERAAVPVQVVPIPVMPVTGVGKIFKPALRLDAAQRAFDAALAPLRADGVAVTVTGFPTPRVGVQVPPIRPPPIDALKRANAFTIGAWER